MGKSTTWLVSMAKLPDQAELGSIMVGGAAASLRA
jgi:hypothetical protein